MTEYIIGIDPGTNTGFAVWNVKEQRLEVVTSMKIHQAMEDIKQSSYQNNILVIFEDARKRKWFGNSGREQLQGAGSIKRDCSIWEDFLNDMRIKFYMVAPMNVKTKLKAKDFNRLTGWVKPTNEHARDAAMLVFGSKSIQQYEKLF